VCWGGGALVFPPVVLGTMKGWLGCCLRLDYACANKLLNLDVGLVIYYLRALLPRTRLAGAGRTHFTQELTLG
jgi:hypothetical protein